MEEVHRTIVLFSLIFILIMLCCVKLMRQKITHYKFKPSVPYGRTAVMYSDVTVLILTVRGVESVVSHICHIVSLASFLFVLPTSSWWFNHFPPFLPWSVSHKHLGNTQAYHIHPWCGTHTFCPLISPLNKHTLAHTVIIHFPLRPCGRATVHVAMVTKYSSNDELSGNTTS